MCLNVGPMWVWCKVRYLVVVVVCVCVCVCGKVRCIFFRGVGYLGYLRYLSAWLDLAWLGLTALTGQPWESRVE